MPEMAKQLELTLKLETADNEIWDYLYLASQLAYPSFGAVVAVAVFENEAEIPDYFGSGEVIQICHLIFN